MPILVVMFSENLNKLFIFNCPNQIWKPTIRKHTFHFAPLFIPFGNSFILSANCLYHIKKIDNKLAQTFPKSLAV